jgi:DNA invertase Pin-like site-specific DNA recombinase
MALIGYARSSTDDQHPQEVQVPRLIEAGCSKVFCDIGQSGAKASRPEWDACLAYLREGDVLVSVKLDRWGRSVQHLLQVAADLEARGVGLRCLDQPVDTTSPVGKLVFTILAAVAEFERALIIERTTQGLAAARARGRMGGRSKGYTPDHCRAARALKDQGMTAAEIGVTLGKSRATIYRMLSELETVA